jgi:hypothetical protein
VHLIHALYNILTALTFYTKTSVRPHTQSATVRTTIFRVTFISRIVIALLSLHLAHKPGEATTHFILYTYSQTVACKAAATRVRIVNARVTRRARERATAAAATRGVRGFRRLSGCRRRLGRLLCACGQCMRRLGWALLCRCQPHRAIFILHERTYLKTWLRTTTFLMASLFRCVAAVA